MIYFVHVNGSKIAFRDASHAVAVAKELGGLVSAASYPELS